MEVYVILLTVNRVTVLAMVHRWGRQRTTGAELVDDDGWRALAFPLTTWCGELEPQGDSSAWEGTSNQERVTTPDGSTTVDGGNLGHASGHVVELSGFEGDPSLIST